VKIRALLRRLSGIARPKHNTKEDSRQAMRLPLQVRQNHLLRMSFLPGGKTMKALFVATVLTIIAAATVTVLTTRPQQAVEACTAAEC
jgi:hypothetical protein